MENNQYYLSLPRIIKERGNILSLKTAGLEYSQIFEMMGNMIENGYAAKVKGRILITDEGLTKIEELNNTLGNQNASRWIDPEYRSQVEKLAEDDLYLPRRNELTFLF